MNADAKVTYQDTHRLEIVHIGHLGCAITAGVLVEDACQQTAAEAIAERDAARAEAERLQRLLNECARDAHVFGPKMHHALPFNDCASRRCTEARAALRGDAPPSEQPQEAEP